MPFDARSTESSAALGIRPRCDLCPAASHCPVGGASRDDLACWNASLHSLVPLPTAGKMLFESGAPARSLYIVRAGCLKSYTVDEEGNERVRAFYFPGDMIGLDALGADSYPSTVAAVTASQVCRMPLTEVRALLARAPGVMQNLLERISRDLSTALALSGDYTAEQRVAAFLVAMSQRVGGAPGAVRLPMTRRDIASYLRLATETVCRVLTRFEELGRIQSESKTVRMLDAAGLRTLAEPVNLMPVLRAA